jgi:hypothetical protein
MIPPSKLNSPCYLTRDGGLLVKIATLAVGLLLTEVTGVTTTVHEPPAIQVKSPEQFVRSEVENAARLEFDTLMRKR